MSSQWGDVWWRHFPKSFQDMHATTLSFALLLNLKSQYPRANLKQLSLSLWERGTMSKSHHLTDWFGLPWKFIRAISLNLQGKVTKQAITFDRAHKQQPVNAAPLVNLSLKISKSWHRRSKNAFVSRLEVKPERIQPTVSEDVILLWQLVTLREHYLWTQAIYLTEDVSTVVSTTQPTHIF